MQTPLQSRILEQLRLQLSDEARSGDRLNEAEIAEQLGVSRTPIRRVLQQLQDEGVLAFEPRRGFVVKDPSALTKKMANTVEELLDERVMRDMAIGLLNTVVSERALMQRYSVPNGVLMSTLRRLMRDRLVEPSPGRGWIFADVSPRAMADSYRFRQILEPAAILSDRFVIDRPTLQSLDEDHEDAILRLYELDRPRLFDLDARFHRTVAQGAQTGELVNAIERQNNIRRVTEYIGFVRIERVRQSMMEHRKIIAALLDDDRQIAASLMQIHLQVSMKETFVYMEDDLESLRGGKVRLMPELSPESHSDHVTSE